MIDDEDCDYMNAVFDNPPQPKEKIEYHWSPVARLDKDDDKKRQEEMDNELKQIIAKKIKEQGRK